MGFVHQKNEARPESSFPRDEPREKIHGAGDGNRTHDVQLGKLTFYL